MTSPKSVPLIFNADKMAPLKPGAESLLYQPRTGDARQDEPRAVCMPSGFPSGMLYILAIQIVQNPKYIVIIPELQRAPRIIPLDGRAHHRTGLEPLTRQGNKLLYRITIDDPKIFTRPFSQDFELTLRPDWEQIGLLEYVCEENNRCEGGKCRASDVQ